MTGRLWVSLSKDGPEVGGPTGEEEPGRVQRDGFLGFSFKDRPLILNTAGAIPGTMRKTLLITIDSEAVTTAVLKGDICLRTGRSGSLSSGTTLCRVSFVVFLLRAQPAERERAPSKCARTGVGGKGVIL